MIRRLLTLIGGVVLLTGLLSGDFSLSAETFVKPPVSLPPAVVSVTLNPNRAVGGISAHGTVTLDQAAPSSTGVGVALISNNPAVVVVPPEITVPAGAVSVDFTVSTRPVATSVPVDITASSGGGVARARLWVLTPAAARIPLAVFRPSTGQWILRNEDGSSTMVALGAAQDVPVPRDYDGQGRAQIALFRPATGQWLIRQDSGNVVQMSYGTAGDIPVPADYLGQGHAQLAIFRPSQGRWYIQGLNTPLPWGQAGDVPVPGTYTQYGRAELAVYRPATGEWLIRAWAGTSVRVLTGGVPHDTPAPQVYDDTGLMKVAYYRPADQTWGVFNLDGALSLAEALGARDDLPIPADYLGQGHAQLAIYRPGTGQWIIRPRPGVAGADFVYQFGGSAGDEPVPAAYLPHFGM